MFPCCRSCPRLSLLSTLFAGSAFLLLLGVLPSAAQQAVPAARHSAPAAAAAGRTTNIPIEFDLPPGCSLARFPRLRVLDSRGRLVELRPIYITQKAPAGRGQRTLTTGRYRPGTYRLRLEVDYRDAAGRAGTVASPFSTLTVGGGR